VWRSRWPYNFGEFFIRWLLAAPTLLEGGWHVFVPLPSSPDAAPQYYADLFAPVAHSFRAGSAPQGQQRKAIRFQQATLCCIDKGGGDPGEALNASAARELLSRTVEHHTGRAAARAAGSGLIKCRFIRRIPAAWADDVEGRRISNLDALVTACSSTPAFECAAINFEEMRINDTLAAMLSTDVLIGVHGAGISNAAFLRPGAIVIEMFPRTFVEAASWGRMQHSYVARLGVNHVPLLVNETHPHCISRQMDGPGLVEHWRDCDVVVDWETILAYVQMASKAGGLAARMAMLKRSVAAMQMGTRLLDTHKSKHVQLIQSGRAGIARGASLSTPLLSALVAVGLVLFVTFVVQAHRLQNQNAYEP